MSLRKRIKKYMSREMDEVTHEVDEIEEITDEIERSLWRLKESLDLPTEEVLESVEGYKKHRFRFLSSKKRE